MAEIKSCPAERYERRKYLCYFTDKPCEYRTNRYDCVTRRSLRPINVVGRVDEDMKPIKDGRNN